MSVFIVLYKKSLKKLIPWETTVSRYCPSALWLAGLKHVNLIGDPVSAHENNEF